MAAWAAVLVWGGLVGVDATSFLQIMISRPFPAATLMGAALGQPMMGAIIGAVLEALSLTVLPIGAARYPESGTAAVAATAAYISVSGGTFVPALILVVILFALVWERVGGMSTVAMRRLNGRLAALPPGTEHVEPGWIVRRHLLCLGLDFARGALVSIVGYVAGALVLLAAYEAWSLGESAALGLLAAGATGMIAAALTLFGGLRERWLVFGIGLLCGVGLLLAV